MCESVTLTRFKIQPKHDKPVNEAILLGHDEIVKSLKNFIESADMITPLSLAIDGDWGSGKTSVVKTLARKLNKDKSVIVFFEPWKYENADPPMALVQTIAYELNKHTTNNTQFKNIAKNLLKIAGNAISKKYLDMSINDIVGFIETNVQDVESFSAELEKTVKSVIGSKKLIIIIDDLDRCDVENTLLILAIMKLFLDIENCICIAAVDFERLKQAWRTKYQTNEMNEKGKEYLEKIFQIKVSVPKPSNDQIMDYLKELVPDMDGTLLRLMSTVGPKNPRGIKKMLNMIGFRAYMLNSDFSYDASALWTLLEYILTNEKLIFAYRGLGKEGSTFGQLLTNMNVRQVQDYRIAISNHIPEVQNIPNFIFKLEMFLTMANEYIKKHNLLSNNLDSNFAILSNLTNEEVE